MTLSQWVCNAKHLSKPAAHNTKRVLRVNYERRLLATCRCWFVTVTNTPATLRQMLI